MRWLYVLVCVERGSARISQWKTAWSQESIFMLCAGGYTDGCLFNVRRRSCRVHCNGPVLRAYRKVQSVGLSYMLTPKAGASTLRVMESVRY